MDLACPRCPLCGTEPDAAGLMLAAITGGAQIACPNDACRVFMWDGTAADGGMSKVDVIPDEPDPDGVTRARPATADEIADEIADALSERGGPMSLDLAREVLREMVEVSGWAANDARAQAVAVVLAAPGHDRQPRPAGPRGR